MNKSKNKGGGSKFKKGFNKEKMQY